MVLHSFTPPTLKSFFCLPGLVPLKLEYNKEETLKEYKDADPELKTKVEALLGDPTEMARLQLEAMQVSSITMTDLRAALEQEQLGPPVRVISDLRRQRMAIQEAATALVATLLPVLEDVVTVTVLPRERSPLGHTVLRLNEEREDSKLFTRRYLEAQVKMELAGRAAEEILLGVEELSSINQRRLMMARRIAEKLVLAGALHDSGDIGPRILSRKLEGIGSQTLFQVTPWTVTTETHAQADELMGRILNDSYQEVKRILLRNRVTLDKLIEELLANETIAGDTVREIVRNTGDQNDVKRMTDNDKALL